MSENIKLVEISDKVENLTRRMSEMQKSVDLVNEDRSILETIQARILALEERVNLQSQHDEAIRKDIKEEVNKVQTAVEARLKSFLSEVQIKKTKSKSLLERLRVRR